MSSVNNTESISNNVQLNINDPQVAKVEKFTYLGVIVYQHLRWNKHVYKLIERLKYYVICLSQTEKELKKRFYLSFIMSILKVLPYMTYYHGGMYDNVCELIGDLSKQVGSKIVVIKLLRVIGIAENSENRLVYVRNIFIPYEYSNLY